MKKYQCLVCGFDIYEHQEKCSNCNTIIDMDIITKTDNIKTLKYNAKTNINNLEFKNNIQLLENTLNELLLEYYKMYSYKCLLKSYNEDTFFNNNFKYLNEELDEVILHILEHHKLYSIENIKKIIDKSNKKSKYLSILNDINSNTYQKPIENDLRNLLFNNVSIPKTKEYNANKEEGKSYLFLSIVLYIVFIAIVLLFCAADIRNPMMNAALIIPSIVLSKGLCKLILKKKNLAFTLLMFIVSIYLTTFIYYLIVNGFEGNFFINHIKSLFNTFSDIFKTLIERFGEQNEI